MTKFIIRVVLRGAPFIIRLLIVSLIFNITDGFAKTIIRYTFERSADTLYYNNWNTKKHNAGVVKLQAESDYEYQTLIHGERSLYVADPDSFSYAGVTTTFILNDLDYMIELYILIPDSPGMEFFNYPLCAISNETKDEGSSGKLITLVVNSSIQDKGAWISIEYIGGRVGNAVLLDSIKRWYKIQLFHHQLSNNKVVLDCYFDGKLVGTYPGRKQNISTHNLTLGTNGPTTLSTGHMYYDDIILSTPPEGEHPRLLFNGNDLKALRKRMKDQSKTYIGISPAIMWAKLDSFADHLLNDFASSFDWRITYNKGQDSIVGDFIFPYSQFSFQQRRKDAYAEFWLGPQRRITIELVTLAFVSTIGQDHRHKEKAKELLLSLSHWQTWNDPYFTGEWRKYIHLGVGHFMFGIALAYDWLFEDLSPYERLSIQNSLINLGINQTILECLNGSWGLSPELWPNAIFTIFSSTGIAVLALDNCDLNDELQIIKDRANKIINDRNICDPEGGFVEGISYAGYSLDYLTTFFYAEKTIKEMLYTNSFFNHYIDWRIWCMLPGAENFYTKYYFEPTYWDVTFTDYDRRGGLWTTALACFVKITNCSQTRWFLSKRKDSDFSGHDLNTNKKFSRWDINLPFGLFLWTDKGNTSAPKTDTLMKVFSDIGWAIARTGWGATDCILAMKSGPQYTGSHSHHEQGSFIFGTNGYWLIADMGYKRQSKMATAEYHNLLFEPNSEQLYKTNHVFKSYFMEPEQNSSISYFKSVGACSGGVLKKWQRDVIFFNKTGSFVVIDFATINHNGNEIYWQIHTWGDIIIENRDYFTISHDHYCNLLGNIIYPSDIELSSKPYHNVFYWEKYSDNKYKKYVFRKISTGLSVKDIDTLVVIAGFVPYYTNQQDILSIGSKNLKGAILNNERGSVAILFSLAHTTGGKYETKVTDTQLNVIVNLEPMAKYEINMQGAEYENKSFVKYANSQGIITFDIRKPYIWNISLSRMQ